MYPYTRFRKNAPCFAHYNCVTGPYPDENFVVTIALYLAILTNLIARPLLQVLINRKTLHSIKDLKNNCNLVFVLTYYFNGIKSRGLPVCFLADE